MKIPNTKAWKKRKRFPRFDVVPKVKYTERLLRATYNKLARAKNFSLRNFNYDIYKVKRGWKYKIDMMHLAIDLVNANINPIMFMKIMSRFGRYKSTLFMPTPTWLSNPAQLKRFEWFYRSEKKSYPLRLEFKKAMSGWSDLDVYSSVRDSARMVKQVMDAKSWSADTAVMVLWPDLSPWFLEAYARRSGAFADFFKVNAFTRIHRHVRDIARQALRRSGVDPR